MLNKKIEDLIKEIELLQKEEKINTINSLRRKIHDISPFKNEPIDYVQWVKVENVKANDYNPNSVAPPEMELLRVSITQDGYTQPVVTWDSDDLKEVVDGFHRTRVCKECEDINSRVLGYLPIVTIRDSQQGKGDRIASTIRHNRARGKHKVESMSDIVIELKKRNWSDTRIAKELGMDADEVLRLCQISGLSEIFKNDEFSQSWDVGIFNDNDLNIISESDIEELVINDDRILHTWDKWECYPAGFFNEKAPLGMTDEECEEEYRKFLSNIPLFESSMERILNEWINSCEHNLSNERMNRIAWLGQAAVCLQLGIPSKFRGGYNLLTEEEKKSADAAALKYLNKWLKKYNRPEVDNINAKSKTKANIY